MSALARPRGLPDKAMPQLDPESEALKRELGEAFADVNCPGVGAIADCMDPVEAERSRALLGGKRWEDWKDRPLEALADGIHMTQLSFITDWVFHYYLPLYMLTAALDCDEADVLPDDLIGALTRPEKQEDPAWFERFLKRFDERFSDFTPRQLKAILSFLAFMKKRHYQAEHLEGWRRNADRATASIQALLHERTKE